MHDTIRSSSRIALAAFILAAPAQAAPLFFDNFDNSFPGEPGLISSIWPKWPNATDHMNLSDNRSHTPCGTCTNSIRLDPMYHMTLANYHDFGAAAVAVTATAWLWDDNSTGTGIPPNPVNIFVGLFGDSASPTGNTDYLLLGLDPFFSNNTNNNTYLYKSLSGGFGSTSVTRSNAIAESVDDSHWIKLTIQADSLAAGGHVGFYINDVLVGTTSRQPGVSLRYFFMGNLNVGGGLTSNYQFFWFDDVNIVAIPEITDIAVSGGTVTINFIGASSELASDFTLVSASTVNGVYSPAASAIVTGSGGSYQATVSTSDSGQFYRIQR